MVSVSSRSALIFLGLRLPQLSDSQVRHPLEKTNWMKGISTVFFKTILERSKTRAVPRECIDDFTFTTLQVPTTFRGLFALAGIQMVMVTQWLGSYRKKEKMETTDLVAEPRSTVDVIRTCSKQLLVK